MVISVYKFLSCYYGISLNAGCEYSHKILKKHFKFLRTCSFDYANKNKQRVSNGEIVYVKDSYGNTLPYISPEKLLIANRQCDYDKKEDKNVYKENFQLLSQLSDLPDHVVHELLSIYKDSPAFYRVIKAELIKRGIYENKLYRLRKEVTRLEESDFDDKYQRRRKIKCKKP